MAKETKKRARTTVPDRGRTFTFKIDDENLLKVTPRMERQIEKEIDAAYRNFGAEGDDADKAINVSGILSFSPTYTWWLRTSRLQADLSRALHCATEIKLSQEGPDRSVVDRYMALGYLLELFMDEARKFIGKDKLESVLTDTLKLVGRDSSDLGCLAARIMMNSRYDDPESQPWFDIAEFATDPGLKKWASSPPSGPKASRASGRRRRTL